MEKNKRKFRMSDLLFVSAFLILVSALGFGIYSKYKVNDNIKSFESIADINKSIKTDDKKEKKQDNNKTKKKKDNIKLTIYEKPVGVIELPSIDEKLPIYRNDTNENLDKGVTLYTRKKHDKIIEDIKSKKDLIFAKVPNELSLDTRKNDNIVILGHSGTSTSNLNIFLNVPKMHIGDDFYINNGWQTMKYRVYQMKKVLPSDLEQIYIGKPFKEATLITCVPPRINTHRLIVKGKLMWVKNNKDISRKDIVSSSHIPFWKKIDPLKAVIIGLLIFIVIDNIRLRLKRRRQALRASENT